MTGSMDIRATLATRRPCLLLALVYALDTSRAYTITADLLHTAGWSIILNFHATISTEGFS